MPQYGERDPGITKPKKPTTLPASPPPMGTGLGTAATGTMTGAALHWHGARCYDSLIVIPAELFAEASGRRILCEFPAGSEQPRSEGIWACT